LSDACSRQTGEDCEVFMPLWHGYTKLSAEYVFAMSLAALMCPLLRYDDDNHDITTAEDAAMNIHNRHTVTCWCS